MSTDADWLAFPSDPSWDPTPLELAELAEALEPWWPDAEGAACRDIGSCFVDGRAPKLKKPFGGTIQAPAHLLVELGEDVGEAMEDDFEAHAIGAVLYLGPRVHVPHSGWVTVEKAPRVARKVLRPVITEGDRLTDPAPFKGKRWRWPSVSFDRVFDVHTYDVQPVLVVDRKERKGRNPFTGEPMMIRPTFDATYAGFCRSFLEIEFEGWPREEAGGALLEALSDATGTRWIGYLHDNQG